MNIEDRENLKKIILGFLKRYPGSVESEVVSFHVPFDNEPELEQECRNILAELVKEGTIYQNRGGGYVAKQEGV